MLNSFLAVTLHTLNGLKFNIKLWWLSFLLSVMIAPLVNLDSSLVITMFTICLTDDILFRQINRHIQRFVYIFLIGLYLYNNFDFIFTFITCAIFYLMLLLLSNDIGGADIRALFTTHIIAVYNFGINVGSMLMSILLVILWALYKFNQNKLIATPYIMGYAVILTLI